MPAGSGKYVPRHSTASPPATHAVAPSAPAPQDGTYSYAALEQLWVQAGGNPAHEAFAACIAEHESGGNPGAISPTVDYGLWQEHDDPAALNPAVSARTAVQMSADGTNWSPWTTEPDCSTCPQHGQRPDPHVARAATRPVAGATEGGRAGKLT